MPGEDVFYDFFRHLDGLYFCLVEGQRYYQVFQYETVPLEQKGKRRKNYFFWSLLANSFLITLEYIA